MMTTCKCGKQLWKKFEVPIQNTTAFCICVYQCGSCKSIFAETGVSQGRILESQDELNVVRSKQRLRFPIEQDDNK